MCIQENGSIDLGSAYDFGEIGKRQRASRILYMEYGAVVTWIVSSVRE